MAGKIVKKGNDQALAEIPEYLKGSAGAGTEELDQDSLTPPRLKLIQALSPELEDFPDLKSGMFYNNISDEIYEDGLEIVPIRLFRSFMLFAPRKDNAGLIARANDGIHWSPSDAVYTTGAGVTWKTAPTVKESGLDQFGTSDPADPQSPPAATEYLNVMCFEADHAEKGPMIYSFYRASLGVGRKFASKVKLGNVAAFGRKYKLTSTKEQGAEGPYFVPKLQGVGWASEADFNYGNEVYQVTKDIDINVKVDGDADAATDTDDEVPF